MLMIFYKKKKEVKFDVYSFYIFQNQLLELFIVVFLYYCYQILYYVWFCEIVLREEVKYKEKEKFENG